MANRAPLVLALALGAAGALFLRPGRLSGGTPAPTPRHWQYASLMTSTRLNKWTTPQAELVAEGDRGYLKLYADLGGRKPADQVSLVDLLNLAGADGWELIAVDGGEGPHQYLFKRPAE